MLIKLGTVDVTPAGITKVYLGDTLIWQKQEE